jgi:hypothetical protein
VGLFGVMKFFWICGSTGPFGTGRSAARMNVLTNDQQQKTPNTTTHQTQHRLPLLHYVFKKGNNNIVVVD